MAVLTIDLTESEREGFTLAALLDRAAGKMLEEWVETYDPETGVEGESRPTKLHLTINRKIEQAIRGEAQEAAKGIAARILETGVMPVDVYGNRSGTEPKPVAAIIAEEVKSQLQGPSGRRGEGVLSELIRAEVGRALKGELKDELERAKKVVVDAVGASAVEALQEAVSKGMGF